MPSKQLSREMLLPNVRVAAQNAGGSGTVIYSKKDEQGDYSTYVLTNHHVVSRNIEIKSKWSPILKRDVKMDFLTSADVHLFKYQYQCVSPNTLVLLPDLRWVLAGELKVGDTLLAFDEDIVGDCQRHFRISQVKSANIASLPSYRVSLANGKEIVCSAEHPWLVNSKHSSSDWVTTEKLNEITNNPHHSRKFPISAIELVPVCKPVTTYEAGYISAAFDGEGSMQDPVSFYQNENAMRQKVKELLTQLGYDYGESGMYLYLRGGKDIGFKFLQEFRPPRLLENFVKGDLNRSIWHHGQKKVTIEKVEFLGNRDVVAMETSTGTFIAEGFAMHNSRAVGVTAIDADIMAYDPDQDLALLKLRDTDAAPAVAKLYPKGEEPKLRLGMPVMAIGAGMGEPPVLTVGRLSQFAREIDNKEYWLSTAPTIFGNSGGALYLEDTEQLIGVPARIAVAMLGFSPDAITHLSFAIPITRIYEFLDDQMFRFIYDTNFTERGEKEAREAKRKDEELRIAYKDTKGGEEEE